MANFNIASTAQPVPLEGLPFNRHLILTASIIAGAAGANSAAVNDTLTFRVALPAGSIVRNTILVTAAGLQDISDAAFNSVTASVGDSGSNLNHIPAKQVALQGTEVVVSSNDNAIAALAISASYTQAEIQALRAAAATLGGRTYAAADFLTVLLTPGSGKNLKDLDAGEIRVYCQLINLDTLEIR